MGFCKQIPGGNLSRLAGMKIDFPNRRVKSVPTGRVEIPFRQDFYIAKISRVLLTQSIFF